MSEGRLDSRELDTIVSLDDGSGPDGAAPQGSPHHASRPARVLGNPLVALLAVLAVVGTALGARSYLVNRPPPLATTVDATLGASFGDTGFITLDDDGRGVLLSLVLRGEATKRPWDVAGFLGPGLTDVGARRTGEYVTVSGAADCAGVPAAGSAPEAGAYRLQVVAQDAWQREVRGELPLPTTLGAQLAGAIRFACLATAARMVRLEEIRLQGDGAAAVRLVNPGALPLYLHELTVGDENLSVWTPPTPQALPRDGHPVEVTLLLRGDTFCTGSSRTRTVHTVTLLLSTTIGSDARPLGQPVAVPAAFGRAARAMSVAPCDTRST